MRRALVAAATVGSIVAMSGVAFAWTATGAAGTGSAQSDGFPATAGAAPTVSVSGTTVNINFAAVATVSRATPATSYLIQRYLAATGGSASGSFSCVRAVSTPNCTDTPGAGTTTYYSYTPKIGAHWLGVESTRSSAAMVVSAPAITDPTSTSKFTLGHSNTGTMSITGSGFVNGAVVTSSGGHFTINSSAFVDSSHITANVTAINNNKGTDSLIVTNPDGGSVTSSGSMVND